MNPFPAALAALLLGAAGATAQETILETRILRWSDLPPLPAKLGLGGPLAGVSGGALIVAGGSNFPDGSPGQGGAKHWYREVYILESGAPSWRRGFHLEHELAYGIAVSSATEVVLIGGRDQNHIYREVRRLRWDSRAKTLVRDTLPPLPEPSCYGAGALIGTRIYVAAGQRSLADTDIGSTLWRLDLARPSGEQRWEPLPPCPGGPRRKMIAAAQKIGKEHTYLFLIGGERPRRGADGNLSYEYLADGWRFDPHGADGRGSWRAIAPPPRPLAAACAAPVGQAHILVFSGSSDAHLEIPVDERPEFPADVLAYHTITDTWIDAGAMPEGVVTTSAVRWGDAIVIPSGEVRPGVRTPAVRRAELQPQALGFGLVNSLVLLAYFGALVWVGWRCSRRGDGTAGFFLAGRRMPWWAAGISIYATQLSAITFVAVPAAAYALDWLPYPQMLTILAMAPVVICFYLPFFRRLNVTTAYEYLERRFDLGVRLFGSASFIAFQLVRMAIVIYLPALALAAITGIDMYLCVWATGLLAILYTAMGGIAAVIWTDVLQTVVLIGGMVLSLVLIIVDIGGLGDLFAVAAADGKLQIVNGSLSWTEWATWSILLGGFLLQFGPYTTDQAVIQRYLTTKDERSAAKSIWLNGILSVPFGLLFFLLGTCFYVFFKAHPDLLKVGMANDEVLPLFVAGQLPPGLSGLVIAGIFAASMSSLDSSMHSIATAATTDWYRRFRPGVPDERCLRIARLVTILVGLLGIAIATVLIRYDIRSLYFFFQKCLGLLASGVVGIFALGIFTRRAHSAGVMIGALVSTAVVAGVTFASPIHFYLYPLFGIGSCLLVGYLTSLLLPAPTKDLEGLTRHSLRRKQPCST